MITLDNWSWAAAGHAYGRCAWWMGVDPAQSTINIVDFPRAVTLHERLAGTTPKTQPMPLWRYRTKDLKEPLDLFSRAWMDAWEHERAPHLDDLRWESRRLFAPTTQRRWAWKGEYGEFWLLNFTTHLVYEPADASMWIDHLPSAPTIKIGEKTVWYFSPPRRALSGPYQDQAEALEQAQVYARAVMGVEAPEMESKA